MTEFLQQSNLHTKSMKLLSETGENKQINSTWPHANNHHTTLEPGFDLLDSWVRNLSTINRAQIDECMLIFKVHQ